MLQKARRDVTSRKLRTLLVVLSVAVGVFGVSAVLSLSTQLNDSLNAKFTGSNPPDITIATNPVNATVIDAVKQVANVQSVEGRLTSFVQSTPKSSSEALQIVGVRDFAQPNGIARTTLKKGTFPKPGEVLFESSSFNAYDEKVGNTVKITGAAGEQSFRVSGSGSNINYPAAATAGFATVFLNFGDAARLSGFADPNILFFKVNRIGDAPSTTSAIRTVLAKNGMVINSVDVRDPKNPPGRDISNLLGSLLGLFAIIALVTSSFLVVNTISTVVAEQRSQIGAMKAVGATAGIILRIYLALALLYGILGTIMGLVLGLVGGYLLLQLLSSVIGLEVGGFTLVPVALVVGTLVGLAVPVLAALLPVWLGSRVTVREAIMSYGLSSNFGQGLAGKIVLGLGFLPQTGVLAARNMLRNRMRVILTVLGLAVAGACIISVYNANLSLSSTINSAIKAYKGDIIVNTNDAVANDKVTSIINKVSGVKFSEGWFITNLQNGTNLSDSVNGVPIDTKVYDTSKVTEGRWFKPGDIDSIVIPELMKRHRNYKLGQILTIDIGDKKVNWKIIGITRDLLSSDDTYYLPADQATQAAGAPSGTVQQVFVKLNDSSHSNVTKTADQITKALSDNGISARNTIVFQAQDQANSNFSIVFVLLYVMVVVVSIVGALGLVGTVTMNVLERQREIGVLRSVGASTGNVLAVFLAEGLMLGAIGWVVAVLLGIVAAALLGSLISSLLLPVSIAITPGSLLLTLVAVLLVAFLAALLPSISAARTQVAEILRYN